MKLKFGICLILGLILLVTANSQQFYKSQLFYQPVNLKEAVSQLKKIYPNKRKKEFLSLSEDQYINQARWEMEKTLRKKWKLKRKNVLTEYFQSLGIYHSNDMIGIILTCYYRELRREDWKLEAQIEHYQNYWRNIKKKPTYNDIDLVSRKPFVSEYIKLRRSLRKKARKLRRN